MNTTKERWGGRATRMAQTDLKFFFKVKATHDKCATRMAWTDLKFFFKVKATHEKCSSCL
jgi:hypothetical protein